MPVVTIDELQAEHDVIVIGGALSGGAAATLLLRKNPGLRVLVVERSEAFGRRVGEATVEVSGFFLGRVLGLTQYLNEKHLCKQGLRFWFANDKVESIDQASEVGPRYLARIPSYQVDRAALDEEVLRRACESGASLLRPATVSDVRLSPGGMQSLTVKQNGTRRDLGARWIIDASGMAAVLARREGWWRPNDAHPTASAWARWRGVKDWDGRELAERFPKWASCHYGTRGTATNHVIGDGWWSWWIPLKGGDVSVGVVFDQRIVDFPSEGGGVGERLKAFLMRHPVARELLENAEPVPEDSHWRKNLAYQSETFAGDGFALVGDAAAFMDPFYSPGMDWISFTASRAADLVTRQRAGEDSAALADANNRDFALCIRRWFDALYRDKYHYMGEYDLLNLAFRLDLGLYYWGVVQAVFEDGEEGFLTPPFTHPAAGPVAALMAFYNRRLARIAGRRRQLGLLGRMNDRRRALIPGFTLGRGEIRKLARPLRQWLMLELTEGWRSWGHAAATPDVSCGKTKTASGANGCQRSGRGRIASG
jgi:flavin-dependent dehydrogenase